MALGSDVIEQLRAPARWEDLDVPEGLLEDLYLRRVLTERITTVSEAADALCLAHTVSDQLASMLREKNLVEYLGVSGRDYRMQLTELGQRTTTQRMSMGQHVGAVPVSLAQYQRVVEAQRAQITLDHERLRDAFDDLVLEDELLDQIGPAFVSGGAIFLYGPAGTGKTSLAERMNRIFDDPVLIPRFIETDGQIISVYDPSLHRALDEQPSYLDRRWVVCERPLVLVGGELDRQMLDLHYDRVSGISMAPIQMLANNGILVVDDFGRQSIRPEEILNRWIVPLSRRVDYLKSSTGTKFTVPFELKLVVSTNLDPMSLGDDAFLRRLRNKVYVGPISAEAFAWVLEDSAHDHDIELTDEAADHLIRVSHHEIGELRPYLAVDFCELTLAVCEYEGCERVLDPDMIDRVAELYFVQQAPDDGPGEDPDARPDLWALHQGRPAVAGTPRRRASDRTNGDHPLAELDALAATLSIEGDHGTEIPAVLRPGPDDDA
jgi:hypothetical protein